MKEHWFIRLLRTRSEQGLNTNIIIVAPPRFGKSITGIKICSSVDLRFTVNNIGWTISHFSSILQSANIKDGSAVMFDEVGVGAKARRWYEEENTKFVDLMQTYGYKHLIAVMTTPSLDYVDSGIRKLFHYLVEITPHHDFKQGWVKVKIRKIQYDPKTGKVYFKAIEWNGEKKVFTRIHKPSDELIAAYNQASELWKENLAKDINKFLKTENAKNLDPNDIKTQVLANQAYFVKTSRFKGRRIVNELVLAQFFNISISKARLVKALVEEELTQKV